MEIGTSGIFEELEDTLFLSVSLEDLASRVGYTKSYLCNCFRGSVGMTISQYRLKRRLTEAALFLKQTSRPISEIAIMTGFSDHSHFTRSFQEEHRMTPSHYRKNRDFIVLTPKQTIPRREIAMYATVEDFTKDAFRCRSTAELRSFSDAAEEVLLIRQEGSEARFLVITGPAGKGKALHLVEIDLASECRISEETLYRVGEDPDISMNGLCYADEEIHLTFTDGKTKKSSHARIEPYRRHRIEFISYERRNGHDL